MEIIGDESELVDRRVKPLLPKIGKTPRRPIPAIMAAARANEVEYLPNGGVELGGVTLAPDEVEILATPEPGTAVAHDEGIVVVIDTELTPELLAEGDARELDARGAGPAQAGRARARRPIELWLDRRCRDVLAPWRPYLGAARGRRPWPTASARRAAGRRASRVAVAADQRR